MSTSVRGALSAVEQRGIEPVPAAEGRSAIGGIVTSAAAAAASLTLVGASTAPDAVTAGERGG